MSSPAFSTAFFAGFSLGGALIVAIGAQNSFVLRQGLRRDHVGVVVLLCIALDVALMALGVSGLGLALGQSERALDVVALLGALCLAAYALAAARRAWRPQALQGAPGGGPGALRRVVLQTLAISLLNPHVYLDTVLLVGAVGAQQPAALRPAFLLGASLASALWFAGLGWGARWLAPWMARPAAWRVLDGLVALTMAVLAWHLARRLWGG